MEELIIVIDDLEKKEDIDELFSNKIATKPAKSCQNHCNANTHQ